MSNVPCSSCNREPYDFDKGFPGGSDSKESAYNARDTGLIPVLERSPGEGTGNPLQYSCLENPLGGGAWWVTVHEVAKESDMAEQLSMHAHTMERELKLWDEGQMTDG